MTQDAAGDHAGTVAGAIVTFLRSQYSLHYPYYSYMIKN